MVLCNLGDRASKQCSILDADVPVSDERSWEELQTFFLEAGYCLQPKHGLSPSRWLKTPTKNSRRSEERRIAWAMFNGATRATHLKTSRRVIIKLIARDEDEAKELHLMEFLSDDERSKDPRNHCARAIETLDHPKNPRLQFVVLPALRNFDDPPFETIGEIVDFIGQIFEGVEFLHDNCVAHTDICSSNVALDDFGVCPSGQSRIFENTGSAVRQYTRTEERPMYLLLDFSTSLRFGRSEERITWSKEGTDRTVPEYQDEYRATIDPFQVDVYCLGNLIKTDIIQGNRNQSQRGYYGLDFLEPVVDAMTQRVPWNRPNMKEATSYFNSLVYKVDPSHLRSRCRRKPLYEGDRERPSVEIYRAIRHTYKKVIYACKGLPAIPSQAR